MTNDRMPDALDDPSSYRTQGGATGLVWSDVLAEMRADAAASGDDRFERADVLGRPRRAGELRSTAPVRPTASFDATPIDPGRIRPEGDAAGDRAA